MPRGGSSARAAIQLELDAGTAARLIAASKAIAGGTALRQDFALLQHRALQPTAAMARANIRAMPSRNRSGSSLRSAIARTIKTSVRTTTPSAAVTVGRPTLRGFVTASFRTQEPGGWRHPVFGNRSKWVSQTGKPNWFSDAIDSGRDRYQAASRETLERFADRIGRML